MIRPLLSAVIVGLGCATGAPGPTSQEARSGGAEAAAEADWVRHIAPFSVIDAGGVAYPHPFLGGFEVPRPQFIDIDGDGDLDLFVQERSDELMFFENTGTATEPRFVWRTDRYEGLSIGEWNRFVDLDGDGDYDLLAEQPFSYIRYYRNVGSPARARFEEVADSVKDPTGRPVFADRQNIPSLADIDCDGRLDLFLGRVDGTITRYELALSAGSDAPRFEFVTERFEGIEIVAQIGSLHGANAMAFTDFDGDGDLDLLWGDFFEPGVLLIENTGGCPNFSLRNLPRPLPAADSLRTSGYNAPVVADIDGDGDLDLFVGVLGGAFNPNRTAADNFYFYERDESGLHLRTRRYIAGIDVGSESIPAFVDLDGDGDLDLMVSNKIDPHRLETGRLYLFRNDGTRAAPRFALADTLDLVTAYHQAPAFADLDGDGDADLLLGTWNEGVLFFRNEGSAREPRFVQDTTATIRLTRGSHSTPALGDLDGDGDLDLVVGEASGELNFYRNTGGATHPVFTLESDVWLEIDAGRRSFPVLVDLDGDGDLDLVVGREEGGALLFRNTGTATDPVFTAEGELGPPLPHVSTPALADLDGDGDLEIVSGGLGGGLVYFEKRGR